MSRRRSKRVCLAFGAALLLAAGAAALLVAPAAEACGGMFMKRAWSDERRPSLAYEQTLIVHDADKGREHFVREVVFRASRETFGFIVPTPSRPEVARVKKSPFERLRTFYPFHENRIPAGLGQLGGGSGSGTEGGRPRGVQVLEVTKVGSFTAFVLAATDEGALSSWLKKQELVSGPATDAWLRHYVKLGFYFVAMRYDPPGDGAELEAGKTKAETLRFSFDSALPYYPYQEPDPAKPGGGTEPRLLEVWLVSQKAGVPVARLEREGRAQWVRPMAEGYRYQQPSRSDLEEALGDDAKLLPRGDAIVQRFMDQKVSRTGFGDVVWAPAEPRPLDPAQQKRLTPLLAVLDPSLAEGKP